MSFSIDLKQIDSLFQILSLSNQACETVECEGLDNHAHFKNFGYSMLTLFRVSTGDNWNGILKVTYLILSTLNFASISEFFDVIFLLFLSFNRIRLTQTDARQTRWMVVKSSKILPQFTSLYSC